MGDELGDELGDFDLDNDDVFGAGDEGAPTDPGADDIPPWASAIVCLVIVLVVFREQIQQWFAGRGSSSGSGSSNTLGGGKAVPLSAEEVAAQREQRLKALQGRASPARDSGTEAGAGSTRHPSEGVTPESISAPMAVAAPTPAPAPVPKPAPKPAASMKKMKAVTPPQPKVPPKPKILLTPVAVLAQRMNLRAAVDEEVCASTTAEKWSANEPGFHSLVQKALEDAVGKQLADTTSPSARLAVLAMAQRGIDFVIKRAKAADKPTAPDDAVAAALAKMLAASGCLVEPLAELLLANNEVTRVRGSCPIAANLRATDTSRLPPQLLNAALEALSDKHGTEAAWGAIEGSFGEIWAAIRGPQTEPVTERLATPTNDDVTSSVTTMANLLSVPAVARFLAGFAESRCPWLPPRRSAGPENLILGREVEQVFLGPLFALGCIPDAIRRYDRITGGLLGQGQELNPEAPTAFAAGRLGECFFPNAGLRGRQSIAENDIEMTRGQIHRVQDELLRLSKALLKHKGDRSSPREAMLTWLTVAVECNANKAKAYANHAHDSCDNLMLNIAYVGLRLCEPFMAHVVQTDQNPLSLTHGQASTGPMPSDRGGSQAASAVARVPPKIESDYAVRCRRYLAKPDSDNCCYESETKFAVETDALDAWVDKRNLARIQAYKAEQARKKQAMMQDAGRVPEPEPDKQTLGGDDDDEEEEADAMDALLDEEEAQEGEGDAMDALLGEEGLYGKAEPPPQRFSFVTECFFLTARAMHHGASSVCSAASAMPQIMLSAGLLVFLNVNCGVCDKLLFWQAS